jgi:alkane 1-monooxygenase
LDFIAYVVLPILDEIFTFDLRNPTEVERKILEKNDFLFKLCLYATIVMDWYLFFKLMTYFSNFDPTPSNLFNLVGLLYIFSNLSSLGFMVAHEIFHKPGWFNKILGIVHMSKNLYIHFTYEHLNGHH